MSIKLINDIFQHRKVPARLRGVLLAICDSANDDNTCWPSIAEIAWKAECSERTVSRAIVELEKMGVLTVGRRYKRSSFYYVDLTALPKKEPWRRNIEDEKREFLEGVLGRHSVTQDFSGDKHDTKSDKHDTKSDKHDTKSSPDGVLNRNTTVMEPSVNSSDRDSNESQVDANAPTPPDGDDSLSGLEGFRSAVKERKSKKSPAPQPRAKRDDRRVWAMVDAYFEARGLVPHKMPDDHRNPAYSVFAKIADQFNAQAVYGCTAYLATDDFWKKPGKLTAKAVSNTIFDWDAQGRPQAEAPKGGGGTSGFTNMLGGFARFAEEQGQ